MNDAAVMNHQNATDSARAYFRNIPEKTQICNSPEECCLFGNPAAEQISNMNIKHRNIPTSTVAHLRHIGLRRIFAILQINLAIGKR
jgi:hypothetical protein